MPAGYTHKIFGSKVFGRLSPAKKRLVRKHFPYFLAGLHGPDILFFYHPGMDTEIGRYGRKLHHEPFAAFFERAREVCAYGAKEEEVVYLCGVLCHLYSDGACHPFVVSEIERLGVSHGKLEMELDRQLLIEHGHEPTSYPIVRHIGILPEMAEKIAPFYGVSTAELLECLAGYRLVTSVMQQRSATLRRLIGKAMTIAGQEDKVASLVMSTKASKLCQPAIRELKRRMDGAVDGAVTEMEGIMESLIDGSRLRCSGLSYYG